MSPGAHIAYVHSVFGWLFVCVVTNVIIACAVNERRAIDTSDIGHARDAQILETGGTGEVDADSLDWDVYGPEEQLRRCAPFVTGQPENTFYVNTYADIEAMRASGCRNFFSIVVHEWYADDLADFDFIERIEGTLFFWAVDGIRTTRGMTRLQYMGRFSVLDLPDLEELEFGPVEVGPRGFQIGEVPSLASLSGLTELTFSEGYTEVRFETPHIPVCQFDEIREAWNVDDWPVGSFYVWGCERCECE